MNIIPFQLATNSVMSKLVVLFFTLAFCNACALEDVNMRLDYDETEKKAEHQVCLADASKDIIWVLYLNDDDLNFKELKTADKMDLREFRVVVEPAIKHYKYLQLAKKDGDKTQTSPAPPKTEVNTQDITKYDVKKQILRMFNKFIMPFSDEPTNLHAGENNKLSLKLYFKGPFTSLVVRYKNLRWNYFLDPPSSLPSWFYEKHTNVSRSGKFMSVEIPESIRNEFYGKFFYLLEVFFSFAL